MPNGPFETLLESTRDQASRISVFAGQTPIDTVQIELLFEVPANMSASYSRTRTWMAGGRL